MLRSYVELEAIESSDMWELTSILVVCGGWIWNGRGGFDRSDAMLRW